MHRIINISNSDSDTLIKDIENVNIHNLDNIVNFSVDTLTCSILNSVPENSVGKIIFELLQKIRIGGVIIIKIRDFVKICELYYNEELGDSELLQYLQNTHSVISWDGISVITKDNFLLKTMEYKDNHCIITLERQSI